MRLYPAAWRERYGAEFAALLEDVGAGWRVLADVVLGGVRMRMMAWTWWKTAAAFAVAGAAVAGVLAVRTPDAYVSTAVVKMGGAGGPWLVSTQAQKVFSRTSLAQLIQQHGLYPEERKRMPLEDIVQEMMRKYIRVVLLRNAGEKDAQEFSISFQYPERDAARRVTEALTDSFVQSSQGNGLQVLQPATLPDGPSGPNRTHLVAAGLALGLIAGFLALGVRRWPLVAASGVAASAIALGVAFAIPDGYVSTAVLRMDPQGSPRPLIEGALSDAFLAGLIQKPGLDLYRDDRAKAAIPELVRRMKSRDLRVSVLKPVRERVPGTALAVSFRYGDRYKAQAVVRQVVTRMLEENLAQVGRHPANLQVLDPASLPQSPAEPNRLAILTLGLGLGLAGGIVATRRRRMKTLSATAV
jgi:capsular polysaccharide biosynthesis protein